MTSNKDKKATAIRIGIVSALLLFLISIYIPKYRLVAELKSRLHETEQQIAITHSMVGDLGKLSHVLADMHRELASFKNRLIDKREISSVISELSNIAKKCSVEVVSIKPGELTPLFDKNKQPLSMGERPLESMLVELEIRATYKATAEYIRHIQESLRILAALEEIDISRKEEMAPRLKVTLILTVYVAEKG